MPPLDISEQFFYLKDHLGSIRALWGEEGISVYQDFDPYGRLTVTEGTDNMPTLFTYTGHYYHSASGLLLAPYRAYNANLGRWISRDPIGENGGINLYGYVLNNPVNLWDPFGLYGVEDFLEDGSNFFGGFADTMTFGATDKIRDHRDGRRGPGALQGSAGTRPGR